MAIDKVKFPDGNTENIQDSRIPGVDSTPTANSANLVTSGGVKSALDRYVSKFTNVADYSVWNSDNEFGFSQWTANSQGAPSPYGTSLNFRDSTSWYYRLMFETGGRIHLYSGINTTNLTSKGTLAFLSDLSDYLPLTGASLSSPLRLSKDLGGNMVDWITYQHNGPFEVGRSSNTMCLAMGVTDDNDGYIQSKGYGITSGGDLVLQPGGGGLYATMNRYKIWHAGNDGSGSGLDADLLDGRHNGDLVARGLWDYEHHKYETRRTSGNITYYDAALHYYLATFSMTDAGRPGADGYILHLGWDNDRWDSQLWIANSDTVASQGGTHMKVRHHNNGADDSSWGDWHSVAMTDSNVASATKLQTARSIWGQSFDGSANVSGLLTSVTGINMTGNLMLDIGSSGIYLNGTGVSIHNASNAWTADALKFDASGNARFYHFLNVGSAFSGDSSRAILSVITSSNSPCDLVLGSSGVNKWTITTRQSSSNYSLGFYSYVTGNWPLWMSHDGNVRIGGPGSDGTDKLQVEGTIKGESMTTYLQTSQPSGGMLPNREYKLGTLSSATTFTLAAETSGVTNHYFWTFETGSTAPTITWPAAITSWAGGSAPSINSNRHYEVSVLNGVAVVLEV